MCIRDRAQLVLAVFDGSDALDENDLRVIRCCKDAVCIALEMCIRDRPQNGRSFKYSTYGRIYIFI